MYQKSGITNPGKLQESNIDDVKEQYIYSVYTLGAKLACYLNIYPLLCDRILKECVDGVEKILESVNKYNEIIYDVLVSAIYNTLYETKLIETTHERELTLLYPPKDPDYYEFSASDEMVIEQTSSLLTPTQAAKSFHADTYCFDSKPEKECFLQYIRSNKVKEIYFTGMFTANQGDFHIQYYDPESGRMRSYYPDFIAKLDDDTYQIMEVKGDNKLEDEIVIAKQEAAQQMAVTSNMQYVMLPGSKIMKETII